MVEDREVVACEKIFTKLSQDTFLIVGMPADVNRFL